FAAPPLDVFGFAKRSLRSPPPRINPSTQPADGRFKIKSFTRANAHCDERWKSVRSAFDFLWARACSRRRSDSRPKGLPISLELPKAAIF
ncbi:hypothetical protein K5E40_19485, partial [Pseudomonas baetica]|uniref:hypothetical protein n=1 Tax=Pseudomonas baetica TaxID=674054 RepID=UPI001C8C1AE3